MISWLRGLGSSLHRDCLTLQTLTGSGSTEGSSFGPNVTVVLEVQPGHSQGLGQASTMSTTPVVPLFGRAGSHHGALATTLLHPGLRPWWARLALSPACSRMALPLGSLSGPAATPWPWAGRTPTRPRHRFWFSATSDNLASLAVLFTCTSTSMQLGSCHILSRPGYTLETSFFTC